MPVIPVEPGNWPGLVVASARLCMCPGSLEESESLDRAWTAFAAFGFFRHFGGEKVMVSQADLDTLSQGSAHSVPLGLRFQELTYGLITAGHVLTYVLRLAEHLPRLASAEAAYKIISARYVREGSNAGLTYIKQAWRTYRPVAHLVAGAFQAWEHVATLAGMFPVPELLPSPDSTQVAFGSNWIGKVDWMSPEFQARYRARNEGPIPAVFACAEALRKRAEKHAAPNQRTKGRTLLMPGEAWCVPEGFALPKATLDLPDLDPDERAAAASVN